MISFNTNYLEIETRLSTPNRSISLAPSSCGIATKSGSEYKTEFTSSSSQTKIKNTKNEHENNPPSYLPRKWSSSKNAILPRSKLQQQLQIPDSQEGNQIRPRMPYYLKRNTQQRVFTTSGGDFLRWKSIWRMRETSHVPSIAHYWKIWEHFRSKIKTFFLSDFCICTILSYNW